MYTYLASPYSGTLSEQQDRYEKVQRAAADLLKRGVAVYSPIVHCHFMAIQHDLPGDFDFWLWFNKIMITQSNCFAVLTLAKWEHSKGIWGEYKIATELGKPILFYEHKNWGKEVEQIKDSRVPELVEILHGIHGA